MHNLKPHILNLIIKSNIANVKLGLIKRNIILLYHSVDHGLTDYPYSVSTNNFMKHLDFLLSEYNIVSLEEMFTAVSKKPCAALTFDDAYNDFYTNVYPVLLQARVSATVFVPTLYIEQDKPYLQNEEESLIKHHLNWKQMREMKSSGLIEFESHTHSHCDSVVHINKLEDDIKMSMDIIENKLDRRPRYFAYPYGSCNEETHQVSLGCGFDKVFTIQNSSVTKGRIQGRYNIWRKNEGFELFKLTLANIDLGSIRNLHTSFKMKP